jgi:hypothetical protein
MTVGQLEAWVTAHQCVVKHERNSMLLQLLGVINVGTNGDQRAHDELIEHLQG